MNTIWLKIAGAAVVAFLIVIAIGMFTSNGSNEHEQPEPPEETFYDVAREDRERYLAEPEPVETPIEEPDSEIQATEPIQEIPEQQSAPPQIQPAPEPPKPTETLQCSCSRTQYRPSADDRLQTNGGQLQADNQKMAGKLLCLSV
jgi:outer membrane biosynthesis protein TonB